MFTSFMPEALEQARLAGERGEVPVGAVVVKEGTIIARAGNRVIEDCDPTAHAEILAIRDACQTVGSARLEGCDLYVTLEPCPMCASAISQARIARLYYGASDPKSGGIEQGPAVLSHPQSHHKPEVFAGIGAHEAQALLSAFFAEKR